MIRSYSLDPETLLKLQKLVLHYKKQSDKPYLVSLSYVVRLAIHDLYAQTVAE